MLRRLQVAASAAAAARPSGISAACVGRLLVWGLPLQRRQLAQCQRHAWAWDRGGFWARRVVGLGSEGLVKVDCWYAQGMLLLAAHDCAPLECGCGVLLCMRLRIT